MARGDSENSDQAALLISSDVIANTQISQEAKSAFALACVRTATARLRLLTCELDEIGVALKFQMCSPELAVGWMAELGVLGYVNNNLWRDFTEVTA